MNAKTCCARAAETAGVIVPSLTLALLPKCPACVASYLAVVTGMGISFSLASSIRSALLGGSILALLMVCFRLARRASK